MSTFLLEEVVCKVPGLDKNVLRLGFGCMRLPVLTAQDAEPGQEELVDLEHTKQMVDTFMASGFCYFDTARGYHEGAGEGILKKVLVDRYSREEYILSSKLPAYLAGDVLTARTMFNISLEDTQAGYFDYYLLQNLGDLRTEYFDAYGIWEYLEEQKRQGFIRQLGFSFHDSAEALSSVLEKHASVDFVQLQINYADWESESIQSRLCYELVRSYELPVIVMEPLKGGLLADPPKKIQRLFNNSGISQSPASLALRFAASLEGVTTVLSGMSSLEQMNQNIETMKEFKPVDAEESRVLSAAAELLRESVLIPCTYCGYCRDVCPKQVRIPEALRAYNVAQVYGNIQNARESYLWAHDGKASSCVACGMCERICPQSVAISATLKRITELFENSHVAS